MRPRWTSYVAVAVATAGWVSIVSWLERDVNCWIESCATYAAMAWIGLSAILLVGTIGITRTAGRVPFRSLGILAVTFTLATTYAGTAWSYALDPVDTNEVVLMALFLPVFEIPVVFGVSIAVSIVVHRMWPGASRDGSPD